MFGRAYYTLVAGLREWALDGEAKGFDARAIIDEIAEQLSASDLRQLRLLYTFYDIENIINLRAGRTRHEALGNLNAEDIASEAEHPDRLPKFIARLIEAYKAPDDSDFDDVDRTQPFEKALFAAYYKECAKASSHFMREWSRFDMDLRNVTAAVTARRLNSNIADAVLGDNEIAQTLARSSAADFGLRGELPWIDTLLAALADDSNMIDKEHKIDMLRWAQADELTAFDDFSIDVVLAYAVKINLVHRWSALDAARGREMFEQLKESLSARGKIDAAAKADQKID